MTASPTLSHGEDERIPPRERILAVAGDLFYRHGIKTVGVEAIAEAAGTNKMTLYRHFSSKDELVAEYLAIRQGRGCLLGPVQEASSRRRARATSGLAP